MANSLKGMMMTNPIPSNGPEAMLMNMLAQKNPQVYQQFIQMRNSGQNPQQILASMTSGMSQQDMDQIKAMASQLGIR